MGWCIGRTEALGDTLSARRKALAKLRGLEELDDPEGVVVPILIDAILMAEVLSRGAARHHLPSRTYPQRRCADPRIECGGKSE